MLRGVAAWRERTAQTRDQPRGRILKDDAIDEIATQEAHWAPMARTACVRCPKGFAEFAVPARS